MSRNAYLEFGGVGTDEFEVIGGYEFRNWENNRCESVTIQYTDYRTET